MKLTVVRTQFGTDATNGLLFIDGIFECYTTDQISFRWASLTLRKIGQYFWGLDAAETRARAPAARRRALRTPTHCQRSL